MFSCLNCKEILTNTKKSFIMIAPMLIAVIGLVGLLQTILTPDMIHSVFNSNAIHDMFVGTIIGGVSVGQPFVSYILGGELLKEGVSLYAVSAFILAWVTLGVIQLPLEWSLFGGRFTVVRNLLAFIFTFIISFFTVITLEILR
ncbi:permease [Sulfurimonas sp.]|uniref:permease n=1 Tax=Sulfurimonas sp. TaxID=2022749 RepID=UPI003565209B